MENLGADKGPSLAQKFESLYQAEMSSVAYEDLPEVVRSHIESESRHLIHRDKYREGNFSKILCFTHENGDITYLAQQDKQYGTDDETERLTYFVDTRDGVMTGYLEMRWALTDMSDYFKNKPLVGFTRTQEGYFKEGLAERRLRQANAYSLSEYGYPLNSDSRLSKEARKVWERLVDAGLAELYFDGRDSEGDPIERFRFIKN
jgi:hypothetical protein